MPYEWNGRETTLTFSRGRSTKSHSSEPGSGGGGPVGSWGSGSGSGSGVFRFLPDPFFDLGEEPKVCDHNNNEYWQMQNLKITSFQKKPSSQTWKILFQQ